MNNVEIVIKQELQDAADDDQLLAHEEASPQECEDHDNASSAHSVISNSPSSNNGGSQSDEKLLLKKHSPTDYSVTNRRKRKSPPIKNSGSFSSKDSETDDELERNNYASRLLRDLASKRQDQLSVFHEVVDVKNEPVHAAHEEDGRSQSDHPLLKSYLSSSEKRLTRDFSIMSEERLKMQQINSQPRSHCPICGDRANGLHYGIYSCEGCKNFFKRSVLICQERPYVCKFDNACSVMVTEIGGVKQKAPRCQACRYQACLDAGMYHSGIQRTRGGRHTFSSAAQQMATEANEDPSLRSSLFSGFVAKLKANAEASSSSSGGGGAANRFPKMQLPDIGARLHAAHYQNMMHASNCSAKSASSRNAEGDDVTVTITPSHQKHDNNGTMNGSRDFHDGDYYTHANGGNYPLEGGDDPDGDPLDCDYLSRFRTENLIAEVKLLKSRNRELGAMNVEKEKQIWLYRRQLSIMKRALVTARRINKVDSESLKQASESSGFGETSSPQNPTLKALLSDTSLTRNLSVLETPGERRNGSLTLTPVKHPKIFQRSAASDHSNAAADDDPQRGRSVDDVGSGSMEVEPIEPAVILQTEFPAE